ncbi:M81 family peptidase [Buchananella hordeovulneris]|uniref:M81 family metallopeptidase n=1 Tax=Buchananella hordeovulneris TaxID=52770 RepID=UPI000F5E039B|nr:M81 family metallopeptidase [Buchananella hordeovulneris]RRD51605.1 M81 family peptidase [Buchananella hordeovulneris]
MWRVAIGGFHIESCTFSPYVSGAADFTVRRGAELAARYPWFSQFPAVQWLPLVHARALPGGPVAAEFFAQWEEEFYRALAAAQAARPLAGVLLDLHGAAHVQGLLDAEGRIAARVREIVGPTAVISAALDLHGNVSPQLFAACDLLTCYRTAPHIDAPQTRQRAAHNLVARLGATSPHYRARVAVPILLPGEKTSTQVEPGRGLYQQVARAAQRPGLTDAALWMGFPWADEPRCHGAVVTSGPDRAAVADAARTLSTAYWQAADDFAFVGPVASIDAALAAAFASPAAPFFISDTGDNPGAGGVGDSTHLLAPLLARAPAGRRIVFASLYDPAAVAAAAAAGVGGVGDFRLGGHLDPTSTPVPVRAAVRRLFHDTGGASAVLAVGDVAIIVTSQRTQYTTRTQFAAAGCELAQNAVVVVKIGYLEPELAQAAGDWVMALSPGVVDQDLPRLPFTRLSAPLVPFSPPTFSPALSVQLRQS